MNSTCVHAAIRTNRVRCQRVTIASEGCSTDWNKYFVVLVVSRVDVRQRRHEPVANAVAARHRACCVVTRLRRQRRRRQRRRQMLPHGVGFPETGCDVRRRRCCVVGQEPPPTTAEVDNPPWSTSVVQFKLGAVAGRINRTLLDGAWHGDCSHARGVIRGWRRWHVGSNPLHQHTRPTQVLKQEKRTTHSGTRQNQSPGAREREMHTTTIRFLKNST